MSTHELKRMDPLQKQPEHGFGGDGLSPMDPPDAYAPPALDRVSPEEMHPFLRQLVEEHAALLEELKTFEAAILSVQKTGFTRELDRALRHFFHCFDSDFIPHSRQEEVGLFPLLHERLLISGEHSKSEEPTTAVDLMLDDHLKAVQLSAVVLNFLGLAMRLPDERSRLMVLDAALEEGKNLVELLRLHIFREDNVVFSSAHRLISAAEFEHMPAKAAAK